MSTIKADGIQASTGTNTDLTLAGKGTGVPDLAAGFKVGGSAGVPTASIRDDAVTIAKLAAATDGVIITYDASGNPVHVGPGSDGEVLTSTGAGSPPAFEAAAGGGAWTLIETIVLTGQSDASFTSGISSTYACYKIECQNMVNAGASAVSSLLMSTDGGSSYLSSYSFFYFDSEAGSSSVTVDNDTGNSTIKIYREAGTVEDTWSSSISIYGPANSATHTCCHYEGVGMLPSGVMTLATGSGKNNVTTVVDAFRIYAGGQNMTGTVSLYGLATT